MKYVTPLHSKQRVDGGGGKRSKSVLNLGDKIKSFIEDTGI